MTPPDKTRVAVLAVDDDETSSLLHRTLLEHEGYPVDTAYSLKQARTFLAKKSYGILLVDLGLPDGDGLTLLPEARAKDSHALAVILTGFSSQRSAVAAIKSGAYDFLIKPCPSEMLVAAVNRAAEKYELSKALAQRTLELELANRELDRRVQVATQEIFSLNQKLQNSVDRLTETNNAQTRFLEDMTHELKNPLSVVWGYISYLLRKPLDHWAEEEVTRALQNVQRNVANLTEMIDELTETARLDSRKIRLNRELFFARDAVLEAVEGLRLQADEKGIHLSADCSPEATVFADRNRLRQILVNLVTNAIKFTPSGGKVMVRGKSDGSRVHFCVEDTGKGIAPKDAERIFDRFYQVTESVPTNKGLGLGLHIVQGLVNLHGGRIWVESELEKGARLNFTLPCTEASAQAEEASKAPRPGNLA